MINLEKIMIFLQKIIVFNQLFQFPNWNGTNFCKLRKSGYFASTNFREYELFKFSIINYRENSQNSRKPRKFLLAKVSASKVLKEMPLIITNQYCAYCGSWWPELLLKVFTIFLMWMISHQSNKKDAEK